MFSYIKAVYLEVFIEAFCFLQYKQSYLISHKDNCVCTCGFFF